MQRKWQIGPHVLARLVELDVVNCAVEVFPSQVAELFSHQSRRDSPRHQGRLDHQRARAAHEVGQRRILIPAGQPQNSRGQHLVERRFACRGAISALVQRTSGRIEIERDAILIDVQVDPQAGIDQVDRGTAAGDGANLVDNCVLGQLGRVERIAEHAAVHHRIDGQRAVGVEMFEPVGLTYAPIERLLVVGRKCGDRLENAHGRAAAEIGPHQHPQVAAKRSHPPAGPHVEGAQFLQLVDQHAFEAEERLGDHVERFSHERPILPRPGVSRFAARALAWPGRDGSGSL